MLMMMENNGMDAHQVDIHSEFFEASRGGRPRTCAWPEDFPGQAAGIIAEEETLQATPRGGGLPLASVNVKVERYDVDDVSACRGGGRKGGTPTEMQQQHAAPAALPVVAAPVACLSAGALARKAKSSRRNAWGNQSYADLITRAIDSTPEKRLTLSQIYDWMVRFVPYFKDKGDSNSSAGWKNSIRHNLSLHTRFIRVQNEGTGKSSWWMLNPEGGKMGKGPRRRAAAAAAAIDGCGGKYLKTKGRISRKRAGAMGLGLGRPPHGHGGPGAGQGGAAQGSPEHGSPAGKAAAGLAGEDYDPAWTEIHSRTSSSASTLSGCLSPILAEAEADEPEEGGGRSSCAAASPRLYPSPGSSTRSPALGAGSHCPPLPPPPPPPPPSSSSSSSRGELPRLTDLTGAISLDEAGYPRTPHLKCGGGYPFVPGPKAEGPYYGPPAMGLLQLHGPMQAIQENKPVSFQRAPLRGYSESNALQSLLTAGPQYCGKELVPGREGHALMAPGSTGAQQGHDPSRCHNHGQSRNQSQELAHGNPGLSNGHGPAHDRNPGPHQSHGQAHKHHGGLDYSHGPHKAQPDPLGPQRLGHAHHAHNPHAADLAMHGGARPQALSPRVNATPDAMPIQHQQQQQQPYGLKGSAHYGPPRPHPATPACLPPNPAAMADVPQDPCRLASAPHPRWSAVSDPWGAGYYHHPHSGHHHPHHHPHPHPHPHHHHQPHPPHHQPHHHAHHLQGQQAGSAYQAHHQLGRLGGELEMEAGPGGLDCDVESILLSDFMDSAEGMDFSGFDGSLSQGVGMGMGLSLGAFACPPQAHSNQSWVPG